MTQICWIVPCILTALLASLAPAQEPAGVPVAYELPADGPLPKTYRVTLAIVDAKNPDWIISQFAAGVVRTVTGENKGKFVERWDGLDDNFMPVPPGEYGVKGIYALAEKWNVDGEYHAVVPRFVGGISSWMPSPEQWNVPEPFGGDPCGAPLEDVAVGPNGIGVFYYQYLENGLNNPVFDLNKPVGLGQFVRAFGSGGAGGGSCTATDGQTIWSFSTDGGPKYVYRADGKPFGTGSANRNNVYRPEGWVTAMAAWRVTTKPFVCIAQRGKIIEIYRKQYRESDAEFVDKVTVHDGEDGKVLAELPLRRPLGLAAHQGSLYALHGTEKGHAVSAARMVRGVPQGAWQTVFDVPEGIKPFDMEIDSHGRFYISDPAANHVYQLDARGQKLVTFGRLDAQKPGAYDPQTLISPGKLATWVDGEGNDRLIIVEQHGPNRASEWGADGKLLREFMTLQTKANDGYAVDPEKPDHLYVPGQGGWLTRFRVDYAMGQFSIDAVWPNVGDDPKAPHLDHPRLIRRDGRMYLAGGRSYNVYRLAGDRWLLSAAIIRETRDQKRIHHLWHDANGDGKVQEEEYRDSTVEAPGAVLRYHGERWLDDLSMVAMAQDGPDVWRLAPSGFDAHGNPVFKRWEKLLTDPVFLARAARKADAVHGGNELDVRFSSDWAQTDGTMEEGFYVNARGGKNFSANDGAQYKVSRYVREGEGYRLKWRTGRAALHGLAREGEIYGSIHLDRPINGLLSVIDQSRCGMLLYTEDGLYVDTVFPDGRRFNRSVAGVYPQPGEFFAGRTYGNKENGRIYFALGKYTPMIFEAKGWSLKENPVRALGTVQKTVTLNAAQIASPPEIAVAVRGGSGMARIARFAPAIGGAAMDGSMAGWESCEPVAFSADAQQTVEVRCLYDPEHIYLRWHARLATAFQPRALHPAERLFSHDRLADTLSFYIQTDPSAPAGKSADGRPGDARFIFGIFKDGEQISPVALGLYPAWNGGGKANPQTYMTPVHRVSFAHVGLVADAKLMHKVDEDGKGFVLVAAIPRTALPQLPALGGGLRTMVNFEATFNGHNKFWWANSDGSANRETYDEPSEARLYPGSWAPAQFAGLDKGIIIRNWLICGPWGGNGWEQFAFDLRDARKDIARKLCDAAGYPPDKGVDVNARYTGELTQGYWPKPGTVAWKPATIADLDTRVVLGSGAAQVWYGATWAHVEADTPVQFALQGHRQTNLRFELNGQVMHTGEIREDRPEGKCILSRDVVLKKGWNQITFRGYCVGYAPFRAGLIINAPEETLWTIRLSATPPKQ